MGGLSEADLRAVETLYRAFTGGDADLLEEALSDDSKDTPMAAGAGAQPGGREADGAGVP